MTSRDVIIRNTANEDVELVDAETLEHLAGPFHSLAVALAAARASTTGNYFQQVPDNSGRAMCDPRPIQPQST